MFFITKILKILNKYNLTGRSNVAQLMHMKAPFDGLLTLQGLLINSQIELSTVLLHVTH